MYKQINALSSEKLPWVKLKLRLMMRFTYLLCLISITKVSAFSSITYNTTTSSNKVAVPITITITGPAKGEDGILIPGVAIKVVGSNLEHNGL
jgi:hypothetical protein